MSGQTLLRLVLFALPLGLDTLAISTLLGMTPMPTRTRLRFALTFALFEGVMPAIGLLLGLPLGTVIGRWNSYVAGAFIIAAGLWLWYHASKEGEDEAKRIQRAVNHAGWALVAIALTVSLDELAIGFSFGLLRIPIVPALVVIALQALLVSLAGQWIGQRVGNTIGEYAERLVGPVLCLLGVLFIVAQLVGLPV